MLKLFYIPLDVLSKYLVMLSEYTFVGVILGSIITKELPFERSTLILSGAIAAAALLFFGGAVQNYANSKNK